MAQGNTSPLIEQRITGDKIEPMEFIRLLVRQWRWAAASFVVVTFITVLSLSLVRPRWEAQATIRIGEVYDALTGTSRPVEPLQEVLQLLHARPFLYAAMKGYGTQPDPTSWDIESQGAMLKTARFDAIPPTPMIHVTVWGSTAEQTTQFIMAIFDRLKTAHEKLARAAQSEGDRVVEEYTKEIADLHTMQSNLKEAFSSATSSSTNDGQTVLAIASALEKNARKMTDLERQRFLLMQRNGHQTVPTRLIGGVSTVKIASTSRGLVLAFGVVMGLAAGLAAAVLRDYFVRMRSHRLSA